MAILTREQVNQHRLSFYGRLFGGGNTNYMREIGVEGMDLADTTLAMMDLLDEIAARDWTTPDYYGGSYDEDVHICSFCGGHAFDNRTHRYTEPHTNDCLLVRIHNAVRE